MSHCDFVAGWTGGVVGIIVGHPLDTVKVNQQTRGIGIRECFREVSKHGYKGFFRGLAFPIVAQGVINSAFFGVYGISQDFLVGLENSRRQKELSRQSLLGLFPPTSASKNNEQMGSRGQQVSYWNVMISGCVGGIAHAVIACPVDVVKIKLQTHFVDVEPKFKGPIPVLKHILRTQGFRGMFQGLTTQAWRDVPSFGVYMIVYEFGSNMVRSWSADKNDLPNPFGLFLSGGIAGTACWWSILPLDVIKSQIQSQDPKSPNYKGALACAQKIYLEQGLKGFFRGFWSLSIRAFPVNGATLLTYEWLCILCRYLNDN